MSSRIENQQISETIPVHGLISGASIGTWQADYPLTALDFEHIKNGKPVTFNWANSILLATVGFGFNILGKGATTLAGVEQQIYIGEWIALGAGVAISIILYIVGLALPNDRKRVMKEIKEHFNTAPKQR
ncbi:hypothetical protein [Marinomonas aquiplantarum]|uniref:Uncharacterized protein n=1 Tax=Marinomonas aquiplantarum TaxID=491951 RepID=A0A366CX16_9GAMM|nr:hypothetical protein [Marinomonas aquiplantarum]RBO82382.1 hypothetical protein DFP76_106210 [Marinomonas aquiplantarum]